MTRRIDLPTKHCQHGLPRATCARCRPFLLTPLQAKIYDLVRKRPRTCSELIRGIWYLYPQDAPNKDVIKQHISAMNKRLRPRGYEIRARRDAQRAETPYELVQP